MSVADSETRNPMPARRGFTIFELLVVMVLAGIIAGTSIPRLSAAMAKNRLQQAASVVSADLRLAHSMAQRRQVPVIIEVDSTQKLIRVTNMSGDTTFSTRRLGPASEYGLQRVTGRYPPNGAFLGTASVTVYPNGLSSRSIEVTLRAAGDTRKVTMSRGGQVRVVN
jgi:prepilin-type N-terminal cleavage/methylation domain-containing protein